MDVPQIFPCLRNLCEQGAEPLVGDVPRFEPVIELLFERDQLFAFGDRPPLHVLEDGFIVVV